MPKKRPTPEQIVTLPRQIEITTSRGKSVAIVASQVATRRAGLVVSEFLAGVGSEAKKSSAGRNTSR